MSRAETMDTDGVWGANSASIAAGNLLKARNRDEAFSALLAGAREAGFDDVSYLAGLAVERQGDEPGYTLRKVMHHSSCPGEWLETLFSEFDPADDYDIQRFLLGHRSPFVSGHNIIDLMPTLDPAQRDILARKAEAGFAANYIVPLPTAPFARQCYSAMMFISSMEMAEFVAKVTRYSHMLASLAHLFHHQAGGDAHTFLERDTNVATCVRALNPTQDDLLTERQREILTAFALGSRTAAVADSIGVSPITVERHLSAIRAKLGAKTTIEAVAQAVGAGLIKPR